MERRARGRCMRGHHASWQPLHDMHLSYFRNTLLTTMSTTIGLHHARNMGSIEDAAHVPSPWDIYSRKVLKIHATCNVDRKAGLKCCVEGYAVAGVVDVLRDSSDAFEEGTWWARTRFRWRRRTLKIGHAPAMSITLTRQQQTTTAEAMPNVEIKDERLK